jgi:uncharacterized membrane protein
MVSDDHQAQLDEFGRRLAALTTEFGSRIAALTAEFEALKRETSLPPAEAPMVTEPEELPSWLQPLDDLLWDGAQKKAMRLAESMATAALQANSTDQLEELLAYLNSLDVPASSGRDRVVYLIQRNLSLARARTAPVPQQPLPAPSMERTPAPASAEAPAPSPSPSVSRKLRRPRPAIELDLLGPRALAVAGGIVTLLGIVFFFVLAVNRGWIGPDGRVALGGIASAIVFAAGLELKRRYRTTYSALAAVGAGLAGGYATLLSASALYDMLSPWEALLVAVAIAGAGLATALVWRSEIVAGIGLLGAMLVPVFISAQGGVSVLPVAFVAVVFAVLAAVAIRLDWRILLVAGGLGSAPQLLALAFADRYDEHQSPASVLALVSVFFVLYLATGTARHLRLGPKSLDAIASAFILGAGLVSAASFVRLFATSDQRGIALLVLAAAYAAPGAYFFTRERTRDLSALLTFATFTLTAVGFAVLLSGNALAYAWSAEALGLAWLARRVREIRFQLWSAVYLLLAVVHVLTVDAPLRELFTAAPHPASGAPAAAGLAAAAAVFAFHAGPWERKTPDEQTGFATLAGLVDAWTAAGPRLRVAASWTALAFATYAASLGTVALFDSYDWAWVAVSSLWMGVGLGVLALALRRVPRAAFGSLVWIGISAATLTIRAAGLDSEPCAWSLLVIAVGLFAASIAYELVPRETRPGQRDVSAAVATAAVALSLVGAGALLSGQALAYAWAAEAVALVWLGRQLAAPHLRALALAPLACAAIHSLAIDAPPRQLLEDVAHPARGALTALATGVAALLVTLIPAGRAAAYGTLAPAMSVFDRATRPLDDGLRWLACAFGTYALSLGVLSAMSSFGWAYVALAAIWMAIGLTIGAVGLWRASEQLWIGALVWIAATGSLALGEALRMFDGNPRAFVFVTVGLAVLIVSMAFGLSRLPGAAPEGIAAASALISLVLLVYPVAYRLDGRWEGAALLGLAVLYAVLSAVLFRLRLRRNVMTLYWAVAAGVAAVADAYLLHGTFRVIGWASAGVALAWLARRVREPRLYLGAASLVTLAVVQAFVIEAPPTHLFTTLLHPANGTASIFIASLAIAGLAFFGGSQLDHLGKLRTAPWWLAAVLAVYGLSIVIVEVVEWISSAPLHTEFQRGQTAVSAFWGLLGLVLLYTGLKRNIRPLRIAGLACFPISLAKIFLYDLPSLSSVTRALSFLAVGAVLLLGGFFYQRLMSDRDRPPPAATRH